MIPRTPDDRDRALRLRRRVITSVAAGSVGAAGVVGYLAAVTIPGSATAGSASVPPYKELQWRAQED